MDYAVKASLIVGLSSVLLAGGCDGAPTFAPARTPDAKPEPHLRIESVLPTPQIPSEAFIAPRVMAKSQEALSATARSDHERVDWLAPEATPAPEQPTRGAPDAELEIAQALAEQVSDGYPLLGSVVPPGQRQQLTWLASETFTGTAIPTAVLVVHGIEPGPTLCLTAAVHGDELNGIETIRRVVHSVNPDKLRGTLIAVPIVNLQAFHRHSRYLPDRSDLNRFFPGNPTGNSASRIAHSFFTEVIQHCDALVDLHTGSFHRTNLPQLRADLNVAAVVKLTQGFGATVTLHSEGEAGTLRRAAVDTGIPAVTLEAGAPLQVQDAEVKHAVKSIYTLLDKMNMYDKRSIWGHPEPVYYTSRWVRADSGGIMFGQVKLGKRVNVGDLLGTVTDPITNKRTNIVSPFGGRVLGMAMNQFVMPGFATFHIGIETEVDEATLESDGLELDHAVASYEPERDQHE